MKKQISLFKTTRKNTKLWWIENQNVLIPVKKISGDRANIKNANAKGSGIWQQRPFTRLVSWGTKSLKAILGYIQKNELEVTGQQSYEPRNHALNKFLDQWSYGLQILKKFADTT